MDEIDKCYYNNDVYKTHEELQKLLKDSDEDFEKRGFQMKDNEKRFRYITHEMRELYRKKNADYDNSFDESLDDDGLLVAKIRLGDKYKRFGNLIKKDSMVEDETIRETLIDLANYAAMTIMWMDKKEAEERDNN